MVKWGYNDCFKTPKHNSQTWQGRLFSLEMWQIPLKSTDSFSGMYLNLSPTASSEAIQLSRYGIHDQGLIGKLSPEGKIVCWNQLYVKYLWGEISAV